MMTLSKGEIKKIILVTTDGSHWDVTLKKKRKIWEELYDYIEWEDFRDHYFCCCLCKTYVNESCVCYAR